MGAERDLKLSTKEEQCHLPGPARALIIISSSGRVRKWSSSFPMERKVYLKYWGNILGGLCARYCVDKMYCLFIQDYEIFFISLISRN